MAKVRFTCRKCGNSLSRELLPLKHAVKGTARRIEKEAECCENPFYSDEYGYLNSTEETTLKA